MWIDPSGFRWLQENWIKVDRGVSFYNNEANSTGSRHSCSAGLYSLHSGLCAVVVSGLHFARRLRGDLRARLNEPRAQPPSELKKPPSKALPLSLVITRA